MGKYVVKLSAVGNPDYGEPRDIGVPTIEVPAESFAEASSAASSFIALHDLGGGNFPSAPVLENGVPVAEVSYNGKVWPVGGWNIYAMPEDANGRTKFPVPLFNPYEVA
jgi:hypothetical protein